MFSRSWPTVAFFYLAVLPVVRAALGEPPDIRFDPSDDALPLAAANHAASIILAENEWPGVVRAAGDLQADVERVTGIRPQLNKSGLKPDPSRGSVGILIGTVGHSAVIDELVRSGKLDVAAIRGKWESYLLQTVEAPLPGIARALVIAGSDKRGTIYGLYDISEQIGVSPWYWWADVVPEHHDAVYIAAKLHRVAGEPAVRYRGIFLNDEAPDLTNWIRAKFGTAQVRTDPPVPPNIANYGHDFYTKLFELILRLRGNYLWPAMWNNAFNEDDPDNARLANEYGIVMGTSHQEPMLRAQKEWDRRYLRTIGPWNYARNPDVLENFWREGIRRNKDYESIITIGLRGANDTPMAPGGPEANRALLEKIIDEQRRILRNEMNPVAARVPQLWCLYKEVQDFYEAGMRVPDDVTLLWAEDNWGDVRRLPTADERRRGGGAGIYYHFDYHGGPRSYQWLNTSPLPKIWDQMSLAKQYGADRIWIVNVGHFKGYEVPLEYFLRLAWDTTRWTNENTGEFLRLWAAREFGPQHAAEIAETVARYAKYNGRRKPELLGPQTYSLVNYREAESVVADFDALVARAEKIASALPAEKRDAYYELVLFPTQASALVNELYLAAAKNGLYAQQGRTSAGGYAQEVRELFQKYLALVGDFNVRAGGKWEHFMDQPVLGYTSWRDPPKNSLDALKLLEPPVPEAGALGVAIEGVDLWLEENSAAGSQTMSGVKPDLRDSAPVAVNQALHLTSSSSANALDFDSLNQQHRWLDVFNRGQTPIDARLTTDVPWIQLSASSARLGPDQRVWVTLDWSRVPAGNPTGTITVSAGGSDVTVQIKARNNLPIAREQLEGFVDSGGYVAIEPEHYTRKLDAHPRRWLRIDDYGRTLSGMRAEAPVDAAGATPGTDAPCLEYRMYLFSGGPVEVTAVTAPTLNFVAGRDLRYAVAFDDEPAQMVTLVPADYKAQNGNRTWEKSVSDNAHYATSKHTLAQPGYHTLKVWMVDPGVVLQKLIVNLGGLRPSYLGPPESYLRQ